MKTISSRHQLLLVFAKRTLLEVAVRASLNGWTYFHSNPEEKHLIGQAWVTCPHWQQEDGALSYLPLYQTWSRRVE